MGQIGQKFADAVRKDVRYIDGTRASAVIISRDLYDSYLGQYMHAQRLSLADGRRPGAAAGPFGLVRGGAGAAWPLGAAWLSQVGARDRGAGGRAGPNANQRLPR